MTASPRVVAMGQPVPKGGGAYRVGKPYQVAGKTYVPNENTRYRAEGIASWYGEDFHGRLTANGEVFDMESIAAAHPTLPMPSYVRITNLNNGRSMIVRVNDRGPYHSDRVIDVSQRAADLLGFKARGTARVKVEYAGRAPIEGSDDGKLAATLRQDGVAPLPSGGGAVMVASTTPSQLSRIPVSDVPVPERRPFEFDQSEEQVAAVVPPSRSVSASRTAATPQRNPAPVPTAAMAAPVRVAPPAAPSVAAAPLPAPKSAAQSVAVAPAPRPTVAAAAPAAPPAARPAAVAAAPKPQKTIGVRASGAQVAVAGMGAPAPRPAPTPAKTLESTGWIVGPAPAASYNGFATPVSTGSGLY
ncbi:septal ring lytic transglycosylase RlpA family protein [Ancylobacter terrae]